MTIQQISVFADYKHAESETADIKGINFQRNLQLIFFFFFKCHYGRRKLIQSLFCYKIDFFYTYESQNNNRQNNRQNP